MSSFAGHAIAPVIVYLATEPREAPRRTGWVLVLAALALAPDVDYLLRSLILPGSPPIRVTHSLAGSLALPAAVVLVLALRGMRGGPLRLRAMQAAAAGLSHVVLDLLVGVTPAALFWPLSTRAFRLPGGLLPSAGAISLGNPYFYRNLLIELGVLLPILGIVLLARRRRMPLRARVLAAGALACLAVGCMLVSASLGR